MVKAGNIIDFKSGIIFINEHGIIEGNGKPGHIIKEPDVYDIRAGIKQLANGKKHLVMIVAGEGNNMSREALRTKSDPEIDKLIIAQAMVTNHNLAVRIVTSFYFKSIKRDVPIKFFNTREKAIEWLLQYKED